MSKSYSGQGRGGGRGRGDGGQAHRGQGIPFHPRGRGRGGGGSSDVGLFSQGPEHPPVPDPVVAKKENEVVSKTAALLRTGALVASLPARPGFGSQGRKEILWTNCFGLLSQEEMVMYRYSLAIEGGKQEKQGSKPALPKKLARRVVELLIEENFKDIERDLVTDFRSTLISKADLGFAETTYPVRYRGEEEDDPAPSGRQYQVTLLSTGTLSLSQLLDYVSSTQIGSERGAKEDIIQGLNILIGQHAKKDPTTASAGANRHFSIMPSEEDTVSLGAGLRAVRGFFVSARAATARVLVNVQVKNLATYQDGPLAELAQLFMSRNGPNLLLLANFLKRVSIDVIHIDRKNKSGVRVPRFKTIFGLATPADGRKLANPPIVNKFGAGPKDVKFFVDAGPAGEGSSEPGAQSAAGKKKKPMGPPSQAAIGGQYITVYDFFQRNYKTVMDPKRPVINVGTRENPSYLPFEVCMVRPGQAANSKLSPAQTQEMIRFAVRKPALNARSIVTTGAKLLGFEPASQPLNTFSVTINPKFIAVPGRVLNAPRIQHSGSSTTDPRFGSWNLQSVKLRQPAKLVSWTYLLVVLQGGRPSFPNPQSLNDKLVELEGQLRGLGLQTSSLLAGQRVEIAPGDPGSKIQQAIQRFASSAQRPQLIFAIIPEYDSVAVYNKIKSSCDVEYGFINVCVLDNKFARANAQYHANVALKFNLKLGGSNHTMVTGKLGIISEKKTMVVGLDVTHPSPGSTKIAPSVAGIVASIDEHLAQWPAQVRIQKAKQEMVQDINDMLKSRLRLWEKRNGSLPANIIVYRDGVSEGQYNQVLTLELLPMREACKELYPATSTQAGFPKISIIIVGKRHHTRFYASEQKDADRSGNPQNGTVVDRGVTEAANWDFFLQAHTALQGTARPAHYYVVHDEIFRDRKAKAPHQNAADALEELTHNMCYLFGRATKAVSICPPAYYADLVCERARCYLSGSFNPSAAASTEGSSREGTTSTEDQLPDASLVQIHENVRDIMFYT